MNEALKKNLKILANLQLTDTECHTIEKKLAGVEERIEALSAQLSVVEHQLAQEQLQLDTFKKQYRLDENEVKTVEIGIAKSDEKLHGVKTNKEYQSMLKEIDDLKNKKAAIEDRMIETLDQLEGSEERLRILKADLADMQREIHEQQEQIRLTAAEQRIELSELKEERERVWSMLDPKLQKIYARTTQHGNGIGVAPVVNSVCQACRMNIPPQAYIELQRFNALSMCPHCQRIIYPKAILEEE
jgi:uncharacterized protein